MQKINSGFSLIEMLLGVLVVSIIMVAAFQALSSIGVAKVQLIEQTEIEKQAYFVGEKFFEMIKKGGTVDYEEYCNRYNHDVTYDAGHFDITSGFGNFGNNASTENTSYGEKMYYCVSGPGNLMGTGGCVDNYNISFGLGVTNESKTGPQRYGQYEEQFINRNSDGDIDNGSGISILGDEDGNGDILGDDDDLFLGIGPQAFSGSSDENKVGELYLINADGNERTYFRWNFQDEDASLPSTCSGGEDITGTGCLGTIEFLKLTGKDYGYDHDIASIDSDGSQFDGVIDTWLIHEDFKTNPGEVVAGSNTIDYWQAIFPESVHVSDVEFYVYPNKSSLHSWRDIDPSVFIAPYIQIKMKLEPSIKVKRKIRGKSPVVDIVTTIQLSSLDLR